MQGFGKVGSHAARFLHEAGARVVAVSDEYGGVHAHRRPRHRRARCDHVAAHRHRSSASRAATRSTTPTLLALDVDVLVPAAVEGVLDARDAPRSVKARWVVEGANGPTTHEGDRDPRRARRRRRARHPGQRRRRRRVLLRVGAGQPGVLVDRARRSRTASSTGCVTAYARGRRAWRAREGVSLRDAALTIAVRRVAEAHQIRGLYP